MVSMESAIPGVIWWLRQMFCAYALCRVSKQYHWHFYYCFSNAYFCGFKKCNMHMAATEA